MGKKNVRKVVIAVAVLLFTVFVAGQFVMGNVAVQAAKAPKLSAKRLTLTVGKTKSMDRSQYDQSITFIKKCAKGAKVDDGLFSTSSSKIKDYIDKTVR